MATCLEENSMTVEKYDFENIKVLSKSLDVTNLNQLVGNADLIINSLTAMHATKMPQKKSDILSTPYIAYWWWELEEFPEYFLKHAEFFDEIWAPTSFIYENLKKVLGKKVVLAPLILRLDLETEGFTRADFQLPEGVPVFLVRFDFYSSIDRKNPDAAIRAFKRAFKSQTEAFLLIKTINGEYNSNLYDDLVLSVQDRSDIRVWDEKLINSVNNDLMRCVTGYISLHRSEGLGLNILEAMHSKVPVVTTDYGGNLDFCTSENSFLIPFKLIPVEDRSYLYPPLGMWAEPEIEEAAKAINAIAQGGKEIEQKINLGLETVNSLNKSRDFAYFVEKKVEEHRINKENLQIEFIRNNLNRETLIGKSKGVIFKTRNYLRLR